MNTDTAKVLEDYDSTMYADGLQALWGNSDFFNFGYWRPDTTDPRRACEDLVDTMLAFVPGESKQILDVACGLGATTGHIASRHRDAVVTGVNISAKQLTTAKRKRPNCHFAQMDAVTLAFPDASFDAVICVEAVFHFDTREKFLREASRVLKPNGWLVLTDVLVKPWSAYFRSSVTMRNMKVSAEQYREAYAAAGLRNLQIIDTTTESVTRLCRYHRRWSWKRLTERRDIRSVAWLMLFDMMLTVGVRQYLVAAAQKT